MADQTAYADGFEDAIIGIDDSLTNDVPRVVYSKTLMLEILIADGMEEIDAIEHLEYNVYGAYVGKGTPIYMDDMKHDEVVEFLTKYDE